MSSDSTPTETPPPSPLKPSVERPRIRLLLPLFGLVAASAMLWTRHSDPEQCDRKSGAGTCARQSPNQNKGVLLVGDRAVKDTVKVPLNEMAEFDGKSRDEVLALRKKAMAATPELFNSKPYDPAQSVFGRIEDGLPWWGIDGIFLHGPGEQAMAGPSEESRWLVNPALLIGLEEGFALVWKELRPEGRYHPQLIGVSYQPKQRLVRIDYDVSNMLGLFMVRDGQNMPIHMTTRNAQDFGFNYIYVDTKRSYRVGLNTPPDKVHELVQYVHRGSSCGVPGGCNNASPPTPELDFQIDELPASIIGKLWYEKPASPDAPADMDFVIEFSGTLKQEIENALVPAFCHSEWFYRACSDASKETCAKVATEAFAGCAAGPAFLMPGTSPWKALRDCAHRKFFSAEGVRHTPDAPACKANARW